MTTPASAKQRSSIPSSATVHIADTVSELRRKGVDVVDFSAGRAAEHTPDYIVRAASDAMAHGATHQTPARGTPEYLQACAAKLARDNGLHADPDTEIMATLGCKQGLHLALLATLSSGDEVLVEDPCFVSYGPAIRFAGGTPVAVPLRSENGFRWVRQDLERRRTEKTKAIVLCSPHNPTGTVHRRDDLDVIQSFAERHDLVVIADETYERLAWGGRKHVSIATLPGMKARTVTLMGLTKSFCMGGWRIGFAVAPAPILEPMIVAQQHLNTCAGSFAQVGGATAYGAPPPESLLELWQSWEQRCNHAADTLNGFPGLNCSRPEGAFYAWVDVRALETSSERLATRLLEQHHVALVPGSAFGPSAEGFLRVTCVRPWKELDEGLERLRKALT